MAPKRLAAIAANIEFLLTNSSFVERYAPKLYILAKNKPLQKSGTFNKNRANDTPYRVKKFGRVGSKFGVFGSKSTKFGMEKESFIFAKFRENWSSVSA